MLISFNLGGFLHFFGQRQVNDGAWHQIVAVREAGRLYVYVDGTLDTDSQTGLPYKNISAATTESPFNLRALGNRGTPHEWFGGCLDDVRAYARALTANELAAQYNNGLGAPVVAEGGLLFGFTFDETGGDALDVTSNQRHGQLLGGATRVVR